MIKRAVKWVAIGLAGVIAAFVLTFLLGTIYDTIPKANQKYNEIKRLYNKKELIGLTIEECREKLGGDRWRLFDGEDHIVYYGGSKFSSVLGMHEVVEYAIEVYFDENGMAVDVVFRQRP